MKVISSIPAIMVNLPDSIVLPQGAQFIDTNNYPWVYNWLIENGIAEPTEYCARSGFCLYPAMPINCKMNLEYAGIFSLAGLEKLTDVSQAQLGHYLHGRRKPSRRTIDKIQKGVNHFAKELTAIKFA